MTLRNQFLLSFLNVYSKTSAVRNFDIILLYFSYLKFSAKGEIPEFRESAQHHRLLNFVVNTYLHPCTHKCRLDIKTTNVAFL